MTTIYLVNKENDVEYQIGDNLIGAIKQMVADQRDLTTDEIEVVMRETEDETAKAEKRLLNMAQVKQAAHVYGLEADITSTPVTTETPATETPEEKNNIPEEGNKMATKMPKGLGKQITAAVLPITSGYAPQLATLKSAYESARDTLKKIRKDETDAVQTAKDAYGSTEKGTIGRKLAALDLKAARDHKKITIGTAEIAYKTAKLTYDELVAKMDAEVAEIVRGLINGYAPATAVLNNPAPVNDPNPAPVNDPEPAVREVVEEEVNKTDFCASDDTPADDKPTMPVRTYVIVRFGNVEAAVEKVEKTLAASTKYKWVEVKDSTEADMIYVVYNKATMDESERNAAKKLFMAAKEDPARYMIVSA